MLLTGYSLAPVSASGAVPSSTYKCAISVQKMAWYLAALIDAFLLLISLAVNDLFHCYVYYSFSTVVYYSFSTCLYYIFHLEHLVFVVLYVHYPINQWQHRQRNQRLLSGLSVKL